MALQPVKSRICDDIVAGVFAPGTRLTIDRLALRYASSHMPIREALRELAGEGLVRYEPRRGARALPVDRRFIEDLMMLRAELEPLLARLAAMKIDRRGVAELEAVQDDFEAAVSDGDNQGAIDANGRFHRCLNRIADNPEASTIVDRHWLVLSRLWAHYGHAPDRFPGVISDHRSLIAAMANNWSDDAAALMRAHVIKAKHQLLARVDQARADQARADQARADQARADQAGEEKTATGQARKDSARKDTARNDTARKDKARKEKARREKAAAEPPLLAPARADPSFVDTVQVDQTRSTRRASSRPRRAAP